MTYSNSPEAIEDDIDRTRARIEARVDRLSDDLNPVNLFSRLTGSDSRSLPDTMGKLVDLARANPVAACLTVAGAAGLLAGGNKLANPDDDHAGRPAGRSPGSSDPAQRVAQSAASLKTKAAATKNDVKDTAAGVKNSMREGLNSSGEYLRDQAGAAVESAAGAYDKASGGLASAAEEIGSQVRNAPARARDGSERALEWVRENPVPAGLMALAAGATAASLFAVRNATIPEAKEGGVDREPETRAPNQNRPSPPISPAVSQSRTTHRQGA